MIMRAANLGNEFEGFEPYKFLSGLNSDIEDDI
jgi:hypothetical protein